MHDPALPHELGDEIRELKRRLAALERSPQVLNAAIEGGALRILDASGNEIVSLGEYATGYHGLRVMDTSGNEILVVGEYLGASADEVGLRVRNAAGYSVAKFADGKGVGIPQRSHPWRLGPAGALFSTTSASFVKVYDARIWALDADAMQSSLLVTLNAADTAELYVKIEGSTQTDTVSMPGSTRTQWTVDLKWDHAHTLGAGPFNIGVYARRSAGSTADINVYEPRGLALCDVETITATTGGLVAGA